MGIILTGSKALRVGEGVCVCEREREIKRERERKRNTEEREKGGLAKMPLYPESTLQDEELVVGIAGGGLEGVVLAEVEA